MERINHVTISNIRHLNLAHNRTEPSTCIRAQSRCDAVPYLTAHKIDAPLFCKSSLSMDL